MKLSYALVTAALLFSSCAHQNVARQTASVNPNELSPHLGLIDANYPPPKALRGGAHAYLTHNLRQYSFSVPMLRFDSREKLDSFLGKFATRDTNVTWAQANDKCAKIQQVDFCEGEEIKFANFHVSLQQILAKSLELPEDVEEGTLLIGRQAGGLLVFRNLDKDSDFFLATGVEFLEFKTLLKEIEASGEIKLMGGSCAAEGWIRRGARAAGCSQENAIINARAVCEAIGRHLDENSVNVTKPGYMCYTEAFAEKYCTEISAKCAQ